MIQHAPRMISTAADQVAARLSPRRRVYAQRLLDHVCWNGRKVWLDEHGYTRVKDETGLDRADVNLAVDDLFSLGLVDVRLSTGKDEQCVIALADSLEDAV
jgi:hypothetical protein